MYVHCDAVTNVTTTTQMPAASHSAAAGPAIAITRYGAIAKPWHVNPVAASLAFGA